MQVFQSSSLFRLNTISQNREDRMRRRGFRFISKYHQPVIENIRRFSSNFLTRLNHRLGITPVIFFVIEGILN